MSQAGAAGSSGGGGGGGTVTNVSGTANQVAVANGTTTPVISLIGPYTPATYTAHGVLIGEGTGSIVASAVGTAGQVLTSNGAGVDPTFQTSGGGTGDVVGPASAVSGDIAAYDGVTGKLILDSLVPVLGVAGGNVFFGGAGNGAVTGSNNFGEGAGALSSLTTGNDNIAIGLNALGAGIPSDNNVAIGNGALLNNTWNACIGIGNNALAGNLIGSLIGIGDNCATLLNLTGSTVLIGNLCANAYTGPGTNNTWVGHGAGFYYVTGDANCFFGTLSGGNNGGTQTGSNNIAIGNSAAGQWATTESNNICIGSPGVTGDSAVTRLGTTGIQTSCLIAGISGTTVVGAAVLCDATGLLGTVVSSERYKENIIDYERSIMDLRPVEFNYKKTGQKSFGFIAEEVEKVFPALVLYDAEGRADSVAYHEMTAMLLKEIQRLNDRILVLESK